MDGLWLAPQVVLGAAAVALVGCGMPGTDAGATAPSSPVPSDVVDGEQVALVCHTDEGPLPVEYARLEEVWASSNYLRMRFCEARFAGPPPFELSPEQAEVAQVAAGPGRSGTAEDFLAALQACTRLGTDEGMHSIPGTPEPILQAALVLCPEAPQADLMRAWLGGGDDESR